ncbi:MAG: LemA family protein [Cyclobacteriaceae bacterium]|nr:LemA family protein [Cyclobacteriaceae bacterium]MCH8514753.1 LemA family protein [Cyclobacteriaceae bacterium]
MKKGLLITLGVIALVVVLFYSFFAGKYNEMVQREESVTSQWAQVENVYQRRADLIPNLVNTVRGAADFERETLTQVVEARAKATSMNVDPSQLTAEQIREFDQAQQGVSSALGRLMVVVERYPELKANQNFLELQSQLEGTENRISTERRRFNETVREYNTYIRSFPQNILAGMYGFERKALFEAIEGADIVPEVTF